jgi:pimeloyl-ACP methyl ester carboxylesterase
VGGRVLIVVGADEVFTPVSDADAIWNLVPQAVLCLMDGAGNLPGAERPERFNEALLQFLRTHAADLA